MDRNTPNRNLHVDETPAWEQPESATRELDEASVCGVTVIRILENGPYLIKGPLKVLDAQGNEVPLTKNATALCRCGRSDSKPFCDGTHKHCDFSG